MNRIVQLFRQAAPWCIAACLSWPLESQQLPIPIQRPSLPLGLRSYAAPAIPPIRLSNSLRIQSLMRGGNLYLTVQDALALAIENNLNLELDRYGPLQAFYALERAKAGGPLRGVPNGSQQVSSIDSGLGVAGSQQAAGLLGGNGGGGTGGGGGATIQQVGQVTPNLDPVLQSSATFSHLTSPQSNTLISQTPVLIRTVHNYNNVATEGLLTGGVVRFYDYEQYLKENSPSDNLNPAVGPYMAVFLQHSLLQGFGTTLNNRTIRIGQINIAASHEQFRSQLLDLCANVLNLYWDLVSARQDWEVRRQALEITQKFFNDTQYEISVGAIARFQLTRAQAELATRRQDVVISQDSVTQRELALKQLLSHTDDPVLDAAAVIPLDRIEVPATEDLPPLRQLVATATAKRPDVAVSRFRDQTDEINLIGTTNPLLPNLQVYAYTFNRGVAGSPQASAGGALPYFSGGYGTALGQIFRRNFPNNTAGASIGLPVGNRQAQGDYGIDQLQFRQSELRGQKDANQIGVDVANQANALRQARARYTVAQSTHTLQQQLLEADQKRASGDELFDTLMIDQRALIAAELSETSALAAYARARDSLDQVLGETLEHYNITVEEGLSGRVDRQSRLPDVLPER